jgi:YD repeat-containing protein
VVEHGVTGGNAVAAKEIDLAYNDAGQLTSIDRYENGQLAVEGDYSYDSYGRLVSLIYHQGATVLTSYAWTSSGDSTVATASPLAPWSPTGGLMPVHDTSGITDALMSGGFAGVSLLMSCTSNDGTASYSYDATGQLIGVSRTGEQAGESYTWDANGNRIDAGYIIGADNRLLSDGTYRYEYDGEGNRVARWSDANADGVLDAGDTDITQYAWDNRNRLIEVTNRAVFGGDPTQIVGYS